MNDPVFSSTQGISATAFLCIACVFSNKPIEKSYDAIFLGMISKIKTARHTSELQWGLSNPKVSWERKETKEDYSP